ncbi:SUKH-3 domain-containing protein [Streptomyces cellulosae]
MTDTIAGPRCEQLQDSRTCPTDRYQPLSIHGLAAFRAGIHRLELRSLDFSGPGISSARTPFELDPELAWGEADRFTEWGEAIGRRLCPLGEPDHGRFFLGTVEEGVLLSRRDLDCQLRTGASRHGEPGSRRGSSPNR